MNFNSISFVVTAFAVLALVGFGVPRARNSKHKGQVGKFDPGQTHVLNYAGFRFAREYADNETTTLTFGKVISQFNAEHQEFDDADDRNTTAPTVDILDARKNSNLNFVENGFTLIALPDDDEKKNQVPTNWRNKDQLDRYHTNVMVPELKKLYPNATRFERVTRGKVRGKSSLYRPVLVNAVHNDLLLDTESAVRFYDRYGRQPDELGPIQDAIYKSKNRGENAEVVEAVLNIWRPIDMDGPVCDKPLALMDASTFDPEDQRPYLFHIDMWPIKQKDEVFAVPVHKPDTQKWYYYPFMTTNEVLVFVQYDGNREFFCVPHGAFNNPNCSPEMETRSSVDYRVIVWSSVPGDAKQTNTA